MLSVSDAEFFFLIVRSGSPVIKYMNVGSSGDVWDDLMMSIALSVMYLVFPPGVT